MKKLVIALSIMLSLSPAVASACRPRTHKPKPEVPVVIEQPVEEPETPVEEPVVEPEKEPLPQEQIQPQPVVKAAVVETPVVEDFSWGK